MHFALVVGAGEKASPKALATTLCRVWREQGHTVSVGPDVPDSADLALLHIDTTTIDERHVPVPVRGIPFINRHALDISKRLVSHRLVTRDSAYAGAVIVKTNDNCYGAKRWPRSLVSLFVNQLRRSVNMSNWRYLHLLPARDYPVLDRKEDVPGWVWRRRDLVVEQFTPEMSDDGLFMLRQWLFLGDREYGARLFCKTPVVKSSNLVRYDYVHEVPESLRQERVRLKMDFGKFDYVMVNGEAILLDANKTPSVAQAAEPSPNILNLAGALEALAAGR